MIDILFTFAKLLLEILPFLGRGSRLRGTWQAEYNQTGSNRRRIEFVTVKQLSSLVWGTIAPVNNLKDPTWNFYGIARDQVLVGIYFAKERIGHWQGSFTVAFGEKPDKLKGYYTGFEESTQEIVGSKYTWKKQPA